jgi:hypothetical protein
MPPRHGGWAEAGSNTEPGGGIGEMGAGFN